MIENLIRKGVKWIEENPDKAVIAGTITALGSIGVVIGGLYSKGNDENACTEN